MTEREARLADERNQDAKARLPGEDRASYLITVIFGGVSRSGFRVFKQAFNRFDLVDVRRFAPPERVRVRNRHDLSLGL